MPRSMRFSSFTAWSGLWTLCSVSGSSINTMSTRLPSLLRPRISASRPRVAMIAPADGDPGTLGRMISSPHQVKRLDAAAYHLRLSIRWPLTVW